MTAFQDPAAPAEAGRAQLQHLTPRDRELLRQMGVYIGYSMIFLRRLLKPDAVRARLALCTAYYDLRALPPESPTNAVSFKAARTVTPAIYLAIGYALLGARAVRADVAERLDRRLHELSQNGPFALTPEIGGWIGCGAKELPLIIQALGYDRGKDGLYQKRSERLEPETEGSSVSSQEYS